MDFSENLSNLPDSVLLVNLVSDIANSSSIKSGPIGFEGKKSYYPDYAHMLATTADTSQLTKLTNHKSALVKYFAFKALQEKNTPA